MNFRVLVLYATWASLAWGAALNVAAAAGNTWVLDRVAGGYYVDNGMPVWMRALEVVMALVLAGIARLAYLYFHNDVTRRQRNLGRLVILLFAVSTVMNAVSQSRPERYNAIGAAVSMLGIAYLRRRPTSDIVDLRTRH